jgi:hypothetical protein
MSPRYPMDRMLGETRASLDARDTCKSLALAENRTMPIQPIAYHYTDAIRSRMVY